MLQYNQFIVLARAPVEKVAEILAEDAELWERDVLSREVVMEPDSAFVFRLRGHPWSIILAWTYARTPFGRKDEAWEKALSNRLGQPVITYGISDSCGSIGYSLFVDGEVIEDFDAQDCGNRPDPERSYFRSGRREVDLMQIEDIYEFVRRFFVEEDAFDPGIEFEYFFGLRLPKAGERAMVQNPGFVLFDLADQKEERSSPTSIASITLFSTVDRPVVSEDLLHADRPGRTLGASFSGPSIPGHWQPSREKCPHWCSPMPAKPTFPFHTKVFVRSKRPVTRHLDGRLGYVAGITEQPDGNGHFTYGIFLYDIRRLWCCKEDELESTGEVDLQAVQCSEEQARRLAQN
ncbi:MAG: Imm31 family immunity protein [Isosphaeraceae bacterium]